MPGRLHWVSANSNACVSPCVSPWAVPWWVFQTHSFFSSPGSLHTHLRWAGIFLGPRWGCGAWAAGWCSKCTRCLQGSPQDSWVIQYIQCNLPAPLHTACLEKEHTMQDKAKRGRPAALLQSHQLHGWQTHISLFACAAGTALLASLSHLCVGVFTCVCVCAGTPELVVSSHLSALHSPSLIYPQLP